MAVSKTTIFSQAWQTVFNLLNSNLTNPHGSGKWIYASFPDAYIDDKDAYPLVVINSPVISQKALTFGKGFTTIRIPIAIFTTKAKDLDTISDEIIYDMDNNINTLRSAGLHNKRIFGGGTPTLFTRSGFNVHNRLMTFEFEYFHKR